jgi:hypothetical protein
MLLLRESLQIGSFAPLGVTLRCKGLSSGSTKGAAPSTFTATSATTEVRAEATVKAKVTKSNGGAVQHVQNECDALLWGASTRLELFYT